jgi:hypothetical protein
MAEASFTLKAVDATKAAFASVQNSLSKMGEKVKGFKATFAGKGLLEGLGIGGGLQAAQTLIAKISDSFREAAEFAETIEGFTKRSLEFTLRAIKEARSPQEQLDQIMKDRARIIEERKALQEPAFVKTRRTATVIPGVFGPGKLVPVKQTEERLLKIAELIEQENNLSDEMQKVQKKITGDQGKAFEEMDKQRQSDQDRKIAALRSSLEAQEKAQESLTNAQGKTNDAIAKEREELEKLAQGYTDLVSPTRVFERQIEKVNELAADGKISFKDAALAVNLLTVEMKKNQDARMDSTLNDLFGDLDEEAKRINESLKKQNQIFDDAGGMIAQGFEDAILSGQKLSEVIRGLGQDLLRLVFSNMITQPLAKGIGEFLSGRAMGGPVNAGSPYVVGEKGPELFVPHSSGSIVPNGAMGSSGGGSGGVTVNYNIAAGVSRAELVPILEQERRRLKAEIPDMVRRGGAYRSAFA